MFSLRQVDVVTDNGRFFDHGKPTKPEAPDFIGRALWELVEEARMALQPMPKRVVHINPGRQLPWDECCDGLLGGRILTITPLTGPRGATALGCGITEWIVTFGRCRVTSRICRRRSSAVVWSGRWARGTRTGRRADAPAASGRSRHGCRCARAVRDSIWTFSCPRACDAVVARHRGR